MNYKLILGICAAVLCFSSIFFLKPQVAGDSVSYVESAGVLQGGAVPAGFSPNRIITTFGGLELIILFSRIFGSFNGAWLLINSVFFVLIVFIFYKIIEMLFESRKTAFIGALFLAGNYSLLRFGLAYLLDIGGWFFYIFSLYYVLQYAKSKNRKNILLAAASVGVGGLFKEYAFLGILPIAIFIIYENRNSIKEIIKKAFLPAIFSLAPVLLLYLFAYLRFHYTYLDWFGANKTTYIYHSRIIEYIKSFGSLVNLLAFLFLGGLWTLRKEWKILDSRIKLFLFSVFASFLPIFLWPAITQRILFITVPFIIIISGFSIKKYQNKYLLFLPLLLVYVWASFYMDSFILKAVNLPI